MGYITWSLNIKKKWRRIVIWHGKLIFEFSDKFWQWNHAIMDIRFTFFDIGFLIYSDGIEMYYKFGKYKGQIKIK